MPSDPQDASYKSLFTSPTIVRDLICGFVPDPWLRTMRFDTLTPVRHEFTTDRLKRRQSDMVWTLKAEDGVTDVYVVIEFQARPDAAMPLRTWAYAALLLQQVLGTSAEKLHQPWPPVLNLVVYTGRGRWRGSASLEARFWRAPSGLLKEPPQHRFVLIDMHRHIIDNAVAHDNMFGILLQFERAEQPEEFVGLINRLSMLLAPEDPLYRLWLNWILYRLKASGQDPSVQLAIENFEDLNMNMKRVFENYKKQCRAEGRSEGLSEGISQGISQGMIEGRLETLTTLLRKKFGQLQADILQKLNTATEEQLKLWSENILDAKTLPEVFRPLN